MAEAPPRKKKLRKIFPKQQKTSANFNLIFLKEKGDEMEASRKIPFLMAESTLPKSADFFLFSQVHSLKQFEHQARAPEK